MRVSTAVLNDLLDDAKIVNPPPAHAGRVAKIYYMTQVGDPSADFRHVCE